jgi:hypothetical protein
MEGVGLDKRVGPHFLRAGSGYGGSCFPKDITAITAKARELGYEPKLLREIHELNERQKVRIVDLLEKKILWQMRQGQDWTRVRLDDGSYLTVTDTGSVMFGDRVKDADLSLSDRPTKKPYGPSLALLDRQRRALERK